MTHRDRTKTSLGTSMRGETLILRTHAQRGQIFIEENELITRRGRTKTSLGTSLRGETLILRIMPTGVKYL
jgi:hypothetical protein